MNNQYTVPFEPTEEQWGGLARDLMMWLEIYERPTPSSLREHLESIGQPVPDWLEQEIRRFGDKHSIDKGTRATLIYKAMVSAAPVNEVVVTWNEIQNTIVAVTRQDEEGKILSVIAMAPTE